MKNTELNYMELAFIMDIDSVKAKEIFTNHLKIDKLKKDEYLKASDLEKYFGTIKSIDARYDGQNELIFNLNHKQELYKRYLNEKSFIKNKKFSGGKTVFYKILNEQQLEHVNKVAEYKHNYVYNRNKN